MPIEQRGRTAAQILSEAFLTSAIVDDLDLGRTAGAGFNAAVDAREAFLSVGDRLSESLKGKTKDYCRVAPRYQGMPDAHFEVILWDEADIALVPTKFEGYKVVAIIDPLRVSTV